jgi:hypothetical protein
MRIARFAAAILIAAAPVSAIAREHRSAAARDEFKREHPCPATGQRRGSCPGYVIDHVIPLCAGGPDRPSNMRWQGLAESKVKDRA